MRAYCLVPQDAALRQLQASLARVVSEQQAIQLASKQASQAAPATLPAAQVEELRKQVADQVAVQLTPQIRAQVESQLRQELAEQLGDQLSKQVEQQVAAASKARGAEAPFSQATQAALVPLKGLPARMDEAQLQISQLSAAKNTQVGGAVPAPQPGLASHCRQQHPGR